MEENKALEERLVTVQDKNIKRRIPALSMFFVHDKHLVYYNVPPTKNSGGEFPLGAKESWLSSTEVLIEDLEAMLKLPHHEFWSNLVFNDKGMVLALSFLQQAYSFYSPLSVFEDSDIEQAYERIAYLVFLFFHRISIRVESQEDWIGSRKYTELLSNYHLLSLPTLIDLVRVYNTRNPTEVRQIVERAFEGNPALLTDGLPILSTALKQILDSIQERVVTRRSSSRVSEADILHELDDLLDYLLDFAVSISELLEIFQPAAYQLHCNRLEVKIASFYERVIPQLGQDLGKLYDDDNPALLATLCFKLSQARHHLVRLFRQCLGSPLALLMEVSGQAHGDTTVKEHMESYLSVLTDCLSEKCFIKDYQMKYPVENDLDILAQVSPDMDRVKYDYVLESVFSCLDPPDKPQQQPPRQSSQQPAKAPSPPAPSNPSPSDQVDRQVEIQSLMTEVKDILPHLGDGYIMECLKHYNYDSSQVINAILECTLPDHILGLDPEMPLIPQEPDSAFKKHGLPERHNVFDNDEFDIMTQDNIDLGRIKGKWKGEEDWRQVLDDKTHREELRDVYTRLGNITVDEAADYDDEYDDTYDGVDMAVGEPEEERRAFTTPRVLLPKGERSSNDNNDDDGEGSEEDDGPSQTPRGGFQAFVENPEIIRARREAYRNRHMRHPPPQNSKVTGGPKGKGQEADVLVARARKDQHKASYANHNRKKMAQKKHGMF